MTQETSLLMITMGLSPKLLGNPRTIRSLAWKSLEELKCPGVSWWARKAAGGKVPGAGGIPMSPEDISPRAGQHISIGLTIPGKLQASQALTVKPECLFSPPLSQQERPIHLAQPPPSLDPAPHYISSLLCRMRSGSTTHLELPNHHGLAGDKASGCVSFFLPFPLSSNPCPCPQSHD
jgi:hypothetical protein